jgi:hypothetical protein
VSVGVGASVLGWFAWTALIFVIAAVLGHRAKGRSLLRPLGFANAPGVALILGLVPIVGDLIRVLVVCWLLAATVVAIEVVFDAPFRRAVVISIACFVLYLCLGLLIEFG